jgi:hypothetical protein
MAKDVRYLTIRVELERTGGEPADPFDVANELMHRVKAVDQVVVTALDDYGYPERTSVYTVKGAVLHSFYEEYDREEPDGVRVTPEGERIYTWSVDERGVPYFTIETDGTVVQYGEGTK